MWSSFEVVVVVGKTGKEVNLLGIAGPNGDSMNRQLSHFREAEVIHAVGAVSGTCCRGWFKPSHGGWHLLRK